MTTDRDAVPGLDPVASARWLARPRTASAWLHEEVGARMAQRLQWFREPPTSWLHWEPVLGGLQTHATLRAALPAARWHVCSGQPEAALAATRERQPGGWKTLGRERWREASPLAPGDTVQMLWSNMLLHTVAEPRALIAAWHERVATGGFLMFSCLGPDSLIELRRLYAARGWPVPAHGFTDMHDWGDMLVHAGFAEPVMDMERLTLTYGSAEALLDELRGIGRNLAQARWPALRARGWRNGLLAAIERDGARDAAGRLTLSVEIVYGHAFKAAPRERTRGDTRVPLQDLREQLRQRRT